MNTQYIQKLIDGSVKVSVYLRNGVKLAGMILAQDTDSILLTSDGDAQKENLVWKDSIASLVRPAMSPTERQAFISSIK